MSETVGSIAVIGLGNMGLPIAKRLHEAHGDVTGFDLSEARRRALADLGIPVARDLGSLAGSDVLVLLLPHSAAVEAVIHDPALQQALRAGVRIVDMSSSEPLRTIALAEELSARGIGFFDAPVSGGVGGAESGSLTVMVGADPSEFDRIRSLVAPLGRAVRAGGVGSGHLVKALNNLLSASHLLATAEAIAAGRVFGLEESVMIEIFNGSSGRSGSTEAKWPRFIAPGSFSSGFSLDLMVKDLGIALDSAERLGAPVGLARAARDLWMRAQASLPPGADHTRIAEWVVRDGEGAAMMNDETTV